MHVHACVAHAGAALNADRRSFAHLVTMQMDLLQHLVTLEGLEQEVGGPRFFAPFESLRASTHGRAHDDGHGGIPKHGPQLSAYLFG